MSTFAKLLTKHKRPIRLQHILHTKNNLYTSNPKHFQSKTASISSITKPILPKSSPNNIRHFSNTQTAQTASNSNNNTITTCVGETKPISQRGKSRPNLSNKYSIGATVNGDFTVQRITPIPSYECTAYEFYHNGTGAQYIHLDTSDTNNAFAITLRTLPSDSSGIAHILEHTTLCGSAKYPVRDPFFHMLKRSLNTFMNAMTSADWTCYPFATQNEQDYHNLVSVYLDSVFYPNLNRLDFMQEGHRLEYAQPDDYDNSELLYKGVVYNEMKGNMSDPNDIFSYNLQKQLFPDNLYQHNFGGNPPDIPKLTHNKLVEFHSKFYHPSNTVFYSYGDLEPQLNEINTLILSKFNKLDMSDIDNSIKIKQELFNEPKSVTATTPEDALVADPEQQHKVCLSWICNDVEDFEETLSLIVLSQLLTSGPNSSFYNSLIKPNIGYGYCTSTGYSMDTVQGTFSVGLNNIKEEDIQKVENIIIRTLNECVEKGFDNERIEAILHQFELDQKHRSGTFGLNLLFRMISLITHRVYNPSPIKALQIDELLNNIKLKVLDDNATDPKYFQNLIQKYMIDNTHRVSLTMKPDKEYINKLETEEKDKLLSIQSGLSKEMKKAISIESMELMDYQKENNLNIDVLPTLNVSDIPAQSPDPIYIDNKIHKYNPYDEYTDTYTEVTSSFLTTEQITNDVSYYKLLYDLKPLFGVSSTGRIEDNDYHLMLPLFTMCIGNMGAADMDYKQLSQKLDLKTGGIGAEIHSLTPLNNQDNDDNLRYLLEINSYCLNRNINNMLELLEDCLLHQNCEFYERLESLIKDKIQSDITHLIESGHSYAISHAASAYSRVLPSLKISEKLEGISQIIFAGQIGKSLQGQRYQTLKELIKLFNDISYQLFKQQGPIKALFVSDNNCFNNNNINSDLLMKSFGPLDYYNHPSVYKPLSDNINPSEYPKPVFGRKYAVLEPSFNSTNKFIDKKYSEQTKNEENTYQQISQLRNYFAVPSQVNYIGGVIPTVPYNHEDCAALRVAAKILSLNFLHHEIREKNGAYGGGAAQNKNIFAFFSYRDPCSLNTCNIFKESIEWIMKNDNVSDKDIDEALLGIFGNLDSPKSPSDKGYQEFLQNIDENIRQNHREQLLSVNKTTLKNVVDKYLAKPFEENEVAFSIVGKQDIDQQEKDKLQDNQFKFVTLG